MTEIKYYTQEGLAKLHEELQKLISVDRPSISKQIAEARDKGDLSENAEYAAAKEAQSMLELKISKLQDVISNARLLDESKLDSTKILIFSTVKLKNTQNNSVVTYTLVPENEANVKLGKISVNSPVSKGLLGKSIGDKVEITIPAGTVAFEIIEISRKNGQ
ncbi:MAG TPA: transcription elongation factor GreA [Bacteroidales bacterium]|jgi:transcription elongation factor GreA|nr:transcription elongation factor GreA [Bacteroidales bacterium]